MGNDLATFLSVIGIVQAGDVGTLTWSIGGPYTGSLLSLLGGEPQGISYSHNKYEADASFGRVSLPIFSTFLSLIFLV